MNGILSEFKSNDGYVRTVYPGTPESTKFGESNSGNVIIVDIESPESPPKLTECNVGQLSWEQCDNKLIIYPMFLLWNLN